MIPESLTLTWQLTAGETDARGRMPVSLIARRAIEAATKHANALGIGYSALKEYNLGWVLARISIEICDQVEINETYAITTWIEGYNRRFSDRCFEMTGSDGRLVAAIRSVWLAIDTKERRMADLSTLPAESFPTLQRECRVPRMAPITLDGAGEVRETLHRFEYAELDFNRHVNAVRHIDLAINQFDIFWYDTHTLRHLDVSYEHECYFHDEVLISSAETDADNHSVIITRPDGKRAVALRLTFKTDN